MPDALTHGVILVFLDVTVMMQALPHCLWHSFRPLLMPLQTSAREPASGGSNMGWPADGADAAEAGSFVRVSWDLETRTSMEFAVSLQVQQARDASA